MSKSARKRRPVTRRPDSHRQTRGRGKQVRPPKEKLLSPEKQEKVKHIVVFVVIAILAAIPFTMGKYMEFNSPGAFDSGAYVYSAQHIINGAKIGVDEKPSAQMGTLLVNILGVRLFGFSETGPELIQAVLQAAALVLMFIAMRKLFGTLPATVGVIIASIYLSAPLIAKFGNVKEQHMIAFMVLGMSCFVLYQLNGRWWCAMLAGAFLSFAPLFKETGTSVLGAVGLFVILQPLLKHSSWKKTGTDILLLLTGAALVIGPICLWLTATKAPINYYPYSFVYKPIVTVLQSPQTPREHQPAESETDDNVVQKTTAKQGLLMKFLPAYVRDSWQIMSPEQRRQAKLRVFHWYRLLILPIALAAGAVIIRIAKMISSRVSKLKGGKRTSYDRFVLLFAVWWLLDMTFVWISPRSYEQYYLPLNASAAMLGGYLIAIYYDKAKNAPSRPKWVAIGVLGFVLMIIMSWHIFFGVAKSPHSDTIYLNPTTRLPEKRRGYAQKLKEVQQRRNEGSILPWEVVGKYIQSHSELSDGIYVWGWWPGIYVQAQRLSPAPKAFEGTMHTLSPEVLSERIDEILSSFKKQSPKFIVDSRKSHFPWNRPPLELWPRTPKGFLPVDEQIVSQYDAEYSKILREKIEPDEAIRYEKMKPFREFIMKNYRIVQAFGQHVLFELKHTQKTQPQSQESDKADG